MADLNDIAEVLASALTEVNLSGELDVEMDGKEKIVAVGDKGDQAAVKVIIQTPESVDDEATI